MQQFYFCYLNIARVHKYTYCDMSSKSISSASIKSTNGKASIPDKPGCIPQSSCKKNI